jgi:hypothetical protein
MSKHLHKPFHSYQVKNLLQKYVDREVSLEHISGILGMGRSRFFELLKTFRENPDDFSIDYKREGVCRRISPDIEQNILKELRREKKLIKDPDIPIKSDNYSYIRDLLRSQYRQKVSLPTSINRAKKNDFYKSRPKRKAHDREVLTPYIGELVQHDSSYHRWAPLAENKWHLSTSLDDYSRILLYADFVERETSWDHISALESVILRFGLPYAYYTPTPTPSSVLYIAEVPSGEIIIN